MTVAAFCGAIGVFFAFFPTLWMGLFTGQDEVVRIGTLYLRVVAPFYAAYGVGMALYFAMQGMGNLIPAVAANAGRLLVSAGGALAAVTWFDAGPAAVFIAIGSGFVLYGLVNAWVLIRATNPR